jgi:hypothetical protein
MIAVLFHLEDHWNYTQSDRDIDILQMYDETLRAFEVNLMLLVDKTTEGNVHTRIHGTTPAIEVHKDINSALDKYQKLKRVFFEHTNVITNLNLDYITLDKLKHPKDDVLYVFGGDETSLNFKEIKLREKDEIVNINISKYILWTIVAISVVLSDRYLKFKHKWQ